MIGLGGDANEGGDPIVHVKVSEVETIEVDECEVVARCGRTDENVSGIVIAMQYAMIVLNDGVSDKLIEQVCGVGVGVVGVAAV